MREIECARGIRDVALRLIKATRLLRIVNMGPEPPFTAPPQDAMVPDFVIDVETRDTTQYTLFFEVKAVGQPMSVRMAVYQLQALLTRMPKSYGIVGAPYISIRSRAICSENGIGFIDLAGNCHLEFDNVYIDIQGRPNLYPSGRPLRSLFAQRSTRMLRVLLCNPRRDWSLTELAEEANISLGQASNVKNRLLSYEFIEQTNRRFRVLDPEALLNKWAANYTYRKNTVKGYYSPSDVENVERELAQYCGLNRIPYAFTLTSGANLVAPFLRYQRAFCYIKDAPEGMTRALHWKEVTSGQNVVVMEPYDEGVFYGLQEIRGIKVVSDVQLYLDLLSYKQRGEEAARFLLERRLRPKWQQSRNTGKTR